MSYEPGKMGVAEGTAIVFVPSFASLFLGSWTLAIDRTATAAWMVPALSTAISLAAYLAVIWVMQRVPGDLLVVAERLLGRTAARLLAIYFIAAFFLDVVLTLRHFAENTLLTALPGQDFSLVAGFYAAVASLAVLAGIEPISRAAYLVIPFGLAGLGMLLLLILPECNFNNLAPWLGRGASAICLTGALNAGFYLSAFMLPLLAAPFQNVRTLRTAALLGAGLAGLFRTLTFFAYMAVFSATVGREKTLPLFDLARAIHIGRYLQRMETFFILVWAMFGLATIAINLYLAAYLFTRLFNLASLKPIVFPLALVALQLSFLPPDIATAAELHYKFVTLFMTAGVFAVPAILLAAALINGERGNKSKPSRDTKYR